MNLGKKLMVIIIALIVLEGVFASNYWLGKQKIEESINLEMQKGLREGNEPFFLGNENNTAGVLLLHGFTASPWEVKELGEYLYINDMNVYGPLIEGHGTNAEDLRRTKWIDWYESANKSYSLLKETNDCVYVGGMSTGSSLALMLAAEHDVCGIIAIGTPIFFHDWKIRFAWIAKYLLPYTTRYLSPEEKPYYYEKRPTAAVAELLKMVSVMKKKLKEIEEPVIIIQSREDHTIKPKSADYVIARIGSERKAIIWFEKGEHVLIKGEQNQGVFNSIMEFIEEENNRK